MSKKPPHPDKPALENGPFVLLVDDDDSVRGLIKNILEQAGYNVLEATNSTEAFTVFCEHGRHIDLLMTDIVMPGMDGYELAHCLTGFQKDLKVIFITGYSHRKTGPDAMVIHKPFQARELLEQVKAFIKK